MTAIPDALGRVTLLLEQANTDLRRADRVYFTATHFTGLYDATVALHAATEALAGVVAQLADLLGARP